MSKAQRFIRNLPTTSDCIEWPYAVNPVSGYGQIWHEGRMHLAPRIALGLAIGWPEETGQRWEAAHGPCHNRLCVNPLHLSWKTVKENQADRLRDGTAQIGTKNHSSKLTEKDVKTIRDMKGKVPQKAIAATLGVSISTISAIQNGKSWTWLK